MPTCDDYQLAFEMQLHGAVPPISADAIAAHIPGCAGCAGYVATTQETATMNTTNWIDHDGFDSARLLERVRAELTPRLRQRLAGIALACVLGALTFAMVWFTGFPLPDPVVVGAIAGFTGAMAFVLRQRRDLSARWVRLADAPAGDLVAARRADLIRRHRYQLAAMALPAGYLALKAVTAELGGTLFWLQLAALTIIAVVAFVQDLRDRRELHELRA